MSASIAAVVGASKIVFEKRSLGKLSNQFRP